MNTKILSKVNNFGKVGKFITTVLLIAAIIVTFLNTAAAIYAATLPKDAVVVAVTSRAEFKIKDSVFSSVWNFLSDGVSYATDKDPSGMLNDKDSSKILPAEDTKLDTKIKFFNQSYSSATVRSDKNGKVVEAESAPVEYLSSDLTVVLIFAALFSVSSVVALLMLQKLFKVLSVCESPFCADFVSKLKALGYSMLPVTLFASIGETLAVRFLSAGENMCVFVQWGMLVAFAVTMCLVAAFRYGVELQKESDETL